MHLTSQFWAATSSGSPLLVPLLLLFMLVYTLPLKLGGPVFPFPPHVLCRSALKGLFLVLMGSHPLNPLKLKIPRSILWSASSSITGGYRAAGSSLSGGWATMPVKIFDCQSPSSLEPRKSYRHISGSTNLLDLQFLLLLLNLKWDVH